jgi:phosphatidylglycerophosphatase B
VDAEQYRRITDPLRSRPRLTKGIQTVNRVLTALGYVMYPLLLVVLAVSGSALLLREILVPGISFVAVSVFRAIYNEQRPYERFGIPPVIPKDTKGKSFPSRHTFSLFMIAMCWLAYCVPVGVVLLAASVCLGTVRILSGVHYPHDVVAGALIAVACGIVGFWMIP